MRTTLAAKKIPSNKNTGTAGLYIQCHIIESDIWLKMNIYSSILILPSPVWDYIAASVSFSKHMRLSVMSTSTCFSQGSVYIIRVDGPWTRPVNTGAILDSNHVRKCPTSRCRCTKKRFAAGCTRTRWLVAWNHGITSAFRRWTSLSCARPVADR